MQIKSQAAARPARRLPAPRPRHSADPARADAAADGASRRAAAVGQARGRHRARLRRQQAAQARLRPARSDFAAAPTRIVSGGVVQSNSQRQVAAAAAKLGLACHLAVYHGRLEPPTPEYKTSGNAFLNRLFGAHLHDVPWTGDRNAAIRALVDDLAGEGPQAVLRALRRLERAGRGRLRHDDRRDRRAGRAIGLRAGRHRPLHRQRRHAGRPRRRRRVAMPDHAHRRHRHRRRARARAAPTSSPSRAKPPTCSMSPSTKQPSKSSPAMPAPPTASRTKPPSKRSASPADSRRWRSIPSIPARASPA